jgi:hypothetical protein
MVLPPILDVREKWIVNLAATSSMLSLLQAILVMVVNEIPAERVDVL